MVLVEVFVTGILVEGLNHFTRPPTDINYEH